MTNFGLFANRTQPTCTSTLPSALQLGSTLQEGENTTQNYIRKADRVVSGADECVSASIKSKLVWPQSRLKLSHANKTFKFLDLPSFQLLVAGEASCLLDKDMPHVERKAHLKLLTETAYQSEKVPWDIARDIHFNVMLGVERGDRKWGDSTLEIQTSLMIGHTVPSITHSKGSSFNGSGSKYQVNNKKT